jgi:hypothetical protein
MQLGRGAGYVGAGATIVKRDGRHQVFDTGKIEMSLRRCGATSPAIKRTVERIAPREGESTSSLRSRILAELSACDATAARCYQSTRRLTATVRTDVPEGTVRINPGTASWFGWKSGDCLTVEHNGTKVRADLEWTTSADANHAYFNVETVNVMRAADGKTRVNIIHS